MHTRRENQLIMEFVGRRVKKDFLGLGSFSGIVKSYSLETGLFEIMYEDGDSEKLESSEVAKIVEGNGIIQEQSGAAELIDKAETTGRKPKRRRKFEIPGDSGNDSSNLISDGSDAKTLEYNLGGLHKNMDMNTGCYHGVDLNLNGELTSNDGSSLNNGLDLNVDLHVEDHMESVHMERLKRSEIIDLNMEVNEDDGEFKQSGLIGDTEKREYCFDLNLGLDDEMKNSIADETQVKGFNGSNQNLGVKMVQNDQDGNLSGTLETVPTFGVLDASIVNDGGTSHILLTGPSNAREGNVGSINNGRNSRKRRKVLESVDSATKTVLRRSTRRGRAAFSGQENSNGAIVFDAVKDEFSSPAFSAVSEEKHTLGLETEEPHFLPPKLLLPPSSESLNLDGIPIFDLFSVYAFLRSFSTILFLSPFELTDFVAVLRCNSPTVLFDYIHLSLLQTLRKHLESISVESSESALNCLRSLNWNFLDLITWPIFMVEYLLLHSSALKPGTDICNLKLLESDYYRQPASLKIEILRCLCDDVNEVEAIRSEVNRRTLTADPSTDFDQNMKLETSKKRRDVMDVSATSCLTEEVDETADWNSDECYLCKMDGSLICCDGCPAAFHSRCVGVASSLLPEGDWYCPECAVDKDKPWMRVGESIRGAELLGIDPYNRLYYKSCGYLLVSDYDDAESPCRYYNRDDLIVVIEALKSSYILYSTLLCAITKFWDESAKEKSDTDAQTLTASLDYLKEGLMHTTPLLQLPSVHPEACFSGDTPKERKPEEETVVDTCCEVSELVNIEPVVVDHSMKIANPMASSERSAELSQAVTGIHNFQNTRSSKRSSRILNESKILEKSVSDGNNRLSPTNLGFKVGKNTQSADNGCEMSTENTKGDMPKWQHGTNYVNFYSFARTASSVAEILMRKSSDKISEDFMRSVEEMISAQLKVISTISTEFCWSNIQNLDAGARKEKCGWCFSCKVGEDGGDCLFVIKDISFKNFTSELLGIHPRKHWKGHFIDVMCHILCIEDRLQGLLLGPWLNSHYSNIWRKAVHNASDISSLKHFLLELASNLHSRALSAEWLKQVDTVTTMGSATHVVTSSLRVSSKHGIGRKRARCPDSDSNPPSNAASGLGLFWWRGGRISRQLFNWKVLPRSLVSKSARQAGSKKIPGISYSDSSEFAKRSQYVVWRASVEASSSVDQLALQLRELDANIRWDTIENPNYLSKMDKEFRKSTRSFKKVIIRRKSSEGTMVKYLLDFGKRRFIPDVVLIHGSMLEEPSSERKKYWLEESYVPLHLLKAFEEKRIARKTNKTPSIKLHETGRVYKKSSKKMGFSYLFSKVERSENYQCGHCNKDVLIREAVSCQQCKGFFHKRHVRKSAGAVTAKCTYTCQKCQVGTSLNIGTKKGKAKLQKSNASKVKMPVHSKISRSKGKRPKQSQNNSKIPVVVPLRRSARKIKLISSQIEKIGGLKKGKKTASRKGKSKKPLMLLQSEKVGGLKRGRPTASRKRDSKRPKKVTWQKKRTLVCHAYWLNGLRFSRYPNDERLVQFRREKLILASERLNTILDKPKCSLCCEVQFTSELNYIGCEICGGWFHGDAFGLRPENIGNLIGFKCHECRNRSPPVCPHMCAIRGDEVQLGMLNADGSEDVSNVLPVSNEVLPVQKSYSERDSNDLFVTDESCNNEQQAEARPCFNQLHTGDAGSRYVPISLERRTEAIHDCIEKDWRPPDILTNTNISLEDISLKMGEGDFVNVSSLASTESPLAKSNVDVTGKDLTTLECNNLKNGLVRMEAFLGSVVNRNPVDSNGLPLEEIVGSGNLLDSKDVVD